MMMETDARTVNDGDSDKDSTTAQAITQLLAG
jgi:hypothetical protein